MKRFCVLLSILAILNMGVSVADAQRWIPDTNLRAAVRDALDLADGDRLTKAEIRDMTELSASRSQISDLTGLEFAKNVIKLELNGNSISDLSPLSGLENLTSLHIWSNDITDVSPLADMTQLEVLRFTKNSVSDLSALAGLVNLKRLSLKSNSVSDVSPLSGLESLEILHLAGNRITNTEPLAGLVSHLTQPLDIVVFPDRNLEKEIRSELLLYGLGSKESVTPEYMQKLTRIWGSRTIRDLSGLEYATNLEELTFAGAPRVRGSLSPLSPLSGLAHLERLVLMGEVTELETLVTLPSLRELTLSHAGITDVTVIGQLTDLKKLTLSNNEIMDISPLASLENLTYLYLDGNTTDGQNRNVSNTLSDISALASLANLRELYIPHNAISDITPLADLLELRELNLSNNDISDVSALESVVNLTSLSFTHNEVTDVSPLRELMRLRDLWVAYNPITNAIALYPLTQKRPRTIIDIDVPVPVVEVPDAALASVLRTALELRGAADITVADMVKLTSLDASSQGITDLTGLEYATNLTSLHLKNNSVSDVEPLSGLVGLEDLQLAGNPLTNVYLLYPLTQQDPPVEIDIEVRSAPPINVPDENFARGLRSVFGLAEDTDIIADDMAGLTYLRYQGDHGIKDITGLEYATNLTEITFRGFADGNSLTDISPLQGLTSLTKIIITEQPDLTDLTPLKDLVNLKTLHLRGNTSTSDITALAGLVELEALNLANNNISDVSPLSGLTTKLTNVDLSENAISDVSPLSGLASLKILRLTDNSISDVSPLVSLVGLEYLALKGNPVTNASSLDPLTQQDPPVTISITVPAPVEVTVTNIEWPNYLVSPYLALYPNDRILGLTIDQAPFSVMITFSEDVTGFAASDIELAGDASATVTGLTGSGSTYTAEITVTHAGDGEGDGTLVIKIPEGTAQNENDVDNVLYSTEDQQAVRVVFYPDLEIDVPEGTQSGTFDVIFRYSEPVTGFAISDIQSDTSLYASTLSQNTDASEYTLTITLNNSAYGNTLTLSVVAHAVSNLEGAVQVKKTTVNIPVLQFAPWDVNEDGNVDATDTALVTAAIGQSGTSIVNSRTDVNGDDTVDAADLLLVTGNLDAADGAAPITLGGIVNLVDATALESLDRDVLQAQLQILRAESDGSVKYRNAIALLEAFLAATRPEETVLLANYPNPFNPETWLPYHLADASNVRITIYDTRGVVVRRLDLGHQREGYYTSRSRAAYWDGRNHVGERVASGIYFYELAADDISRLRKMVILK